ncbi:MAG: cyclic nucleotide-binding domain-containing protein [Chloroflexi bacterium]|nr:cyclic nucleotide-binding domain-containing protein [Chloroflexota bacterium]
MSDVDALRAIPIFAGLAEAQLGVILSTVRPQMVPSGAIILREGEQGDSLFILARGSVEVTKQLGLALTVPVEGVKEKTLVRLDAPQFFGEMGLLQDTERSATVTARGECALLEIAKADFEHLAEADPTLGYLVIRNIAVVLASRLRRTDRDIVKLTMALSLALGNR